MGNKATQPRSFNTIRRSQTKARAKRRTIQRVVLLAMFATVALILVSLLVLGGFMIANTIINARPPQNQDNNPPSPVTDIVFVQDTKTLDAIHTGHLILVNAENRYTFPNVQMVSIYDNMSKNQFGGIIYSPVNKEFKLQSDAFAALDAMMVKNYEITEDVIRIADAYRTMEDQEGRDILPGYSDHHTGYCVAIRYYDGVHIESTHWLYQNAHKYGFIVRYPEHKSNITGVSGYTYCLRYVGVAHATYMYENDLCMEEYLDLLKNNYASSAMRLSINAADGITYEVYYTPASGDELTTLDVPSNYNYTVSGDNRSGFIVTVKMTDPAA